MTLDNSPVGIRASNDVTERERETEREIRWLSKQGCFDGRSSSICGAGFRESSVVQSPSRVPKKEEEARRFTRLSQHMLHKLFLEKLHGPHRWVQHGPSFLDLPKIRLEMAGIGNEGGTSQLQCAIFSALLL